MIPFRTLPILLLLMIALATFSQVATGEDALPQRVDFNQHIRPILSENCFACHGNDEKTRKAKLRLDTPKGAVADLGGYAALAPGNPLNSELYKRLVTADQDERIAPARINC